MHLNELASLRDFKLIKNKNIKENILEFCPKFTNKDKIGVVSPNVEEGIFDAGYATLALVLGFYKKEKTQSERDCHYPPYYCFIEEQKSCTFTKVGSTGLTLSHSCGPWQFFDFWPQSKCQKILPKPNNVFELIKNKKITLLFCHKFYLLNKIKNYPIKKKLLITNILKETPLKTIHIYGKNAGNIQIMVNKKIEKLIIRSIKQLNFKNPNDSIKLINSRNSSVYIKNNKFYQNFKTINKKEFIDYFK